MPEETGQTITVDTATARELGERGYEQSTRVYPHFYAQGDGIELGCYTAERRPTKLERNATGQLIIEVDLNGGILDQRTLDYAHQQLAAAITNHPGETFELRLKRFATTAVPRLIADTGFIYELLVKLIDERGETSGRRS